MTRSWRSRWTRADIVCHDGGTTYRRHAALAGAVCAPFKKYLTSCEYPAFKTRGRARSAAFGRSGQLIERIEDRQSGEVEGRERVPSLVQLANRG